MTALRIEYVDTDDLIPYVNNSRTHSDEQVNDLASSIHEFGFVNPVLIDENCGIIAGHGRLMAAKKLHLRKVPTVMLSGLTEAQRKAYVIADNKLALKSGWDDEKLKVEIERLAELDYDLTLTGFDPDELEAMLKEPDFNPATEEEQGSLDQLDPKYIECPHCHEQFDLRAVE